MRTSLLAALTSGALLPLITAWFGLSAPSAPPTAPSTLPIGTQQDGDPAPALSGTNQEGAELDWAQFEGRVVILYFHTARTLNAGAALEALATSLRQSPDLKQSTTVLLVTDDAEVGSSARAELTGSGFNVQVALDSDRALTSRYAVIAYPTAYVVGPTGTIVGSARGFSTFFGFQLVTASRYAAGLLDDEHFNALRSGHLVRPDRAHARADLHTRMDLRLVASGHGSSALPSLKQQGAAEAAGPQLLALLAHLCLLEGQPDEAEAWLERLAGSAAGDPALPLLRIRLDLARGKVEGAHARLDELRTSGPQLDRVRAQVFELEGRWEEAALLYRDALDCLLYLPR